MGGRSIASMLPALIGLGAVGLLEAWAWRRVQAAGPAGGALATAPLTWASVAFTSVLFVVPWSDASPIGLVPGAAGLAGLATCLPRVMRAVGAGLAGGGAVVDPSARPALGLAVLLGTAKVWGLLAGLGILVMDGMPAPPPDHETAAQAFLLMTALGMAGSWTWVMWPVWLGPWAGGRAALRTVRRGGFLVAALAGWMLLSFLHDLSVLSGRIL
jgi:hypothetical protein